MYQDIVPNEVKCWQAHLYYVEVGCLKSETGICYS